MSDVPFPAPDFSGSGPVEYSPTPHAPVGALALLLARHEARLLAVSGVTSVGIGHGAPGAEALVIAVVDASVAALLPREIEAVPVVVTVTGPVDALPQP